MVSFFVSINLNECVNALMIMIMIIIIKYIMEINMNTIFLFYFLFYFISCAKGPIEGSMPGDCTDGADNDQDGLFDCDDDSCSGSSDCDVTDTTEEEDDEDDEDDEDEDDEDDQDDEDDGNSYDPALIGDPLAGEVLFLNHCSGCHGANGLGGSGPSIAEDVREEDDEDLWEVILEGDDDMPAINVQPQETADIISWLRIIFP